MYQLLLNEQATHDWHYHIFQLPNFHNSYT